MNPGWPAINYLWVRLRRRLPSKERLRKKERGCWHPTRWGTQWPYPFFRRNHSSGWLKQNVSLACNPAAGRRIAILARSGSWCWSGLERFHRLVCSGVGNSRQDRQQSLLRRACREQNPHWRRLRRLSGWKQDRCHWDPGFGGLLGLLNSFHLHPLLQPIKRKIYG